MQFLTGTEPAGYHEATLSGGDDGPSTLVRGDGTSCERLPVDARSECFLSLAIRSRDGRFCGSRYRNFEDASCYILVELANQDLVK